MSGSHPLLFVLISLPIVTEAYKMVVFVPDLANSQVLFNARVAETLAKAGHDVTMVMITRFSDRKSTDVKIMEQVAVYRVNTSSVYRKNELEEALEGIIFEDLPLWDSRYRAHASKMTTVLVEMCRGMVNNKEFMQWLPSQKFDLGFVFPVDLCTAALLRHAKVPTWIWLSSGGLVDFMAHYAGAPHIPSYVPPLAMASTDEMNFVERIKSFIGYPLTIGLFKKMVADPQTTILRELVDPHTPDLIEIAKSAPLIMVNTNELYDLPRPSLAKIINIGGVGMQFKDAQPLPAVYQKIVDGCEGLVVFSFGSVTPSHQMPESWKTAFLEAFARFPKLSFVVRYVKSDLKDRLPPNVHLFKWLPQADLLKNPKTIAFISHGGYNSLQEAITAGVPLITIPLFGDQFRNAKIAERHRIAIILRKGDVNVNTIADALQMLLDKKRDAIADLAAMRREGVVDEQIDQCGNYSRNVKRLSDMVRKKPVSASHLLVSWAEFVAEFKTLDNLVPAGTKLNFVQYHSLDVLAFLTTLLAILLFVIWKTLKLIVLGVYVVIRVIRKQKTE